MDVRPEELLIDLLARMIAADRHVAVGAASPIPGTAALLAQVEASQRMHVTLLHSRRDNRFTDGARELFDCAGQGRIDTFFLGGVQIDGKANINLVGLGDYPRLERRFPGSYGSAYMYFAVPRVILFREEHSRRVLVPKVDFISAPGWSPAGVYRPGGPVALVTPLCLFTFDKAKRRFALASLHAGVTLERVRDETGFEFDAPGKVPETIPPQNAWLALLRGRVAREIADPYPQFAARVLGAAPEAA